jgi:aldehyde dehydrogenase (NAD+)
MMHALRGASLASIDRAPAVEISERVMMRNHRHLASVAEETRELLQKLGVRREAWTGGDLVVRSPITGEEIGAVHAIDATGVANAIGRAADSFRLWRATPAPARGEFVRLFAQELRAHKDALGRLVSIEAGKIVSEGQGEVQEMIDICDYAVGLSRQLFGLTMTSERRNHRMMETWHPLGVTGIITAFNFPVAVWAWNAALALVCGNAIVWKPSKKTPLTALATQALFDSAAVKFGGVPKELSTVLIGGRAIAEALVEDARVPLVSATGSTAMGRAIAPRLAARFARALLELGGNNAAIVCPSADLDLALPAIAFAAMGTAGQRCTTLRRLFVHESIYDIFMPRLKELYAAVKIGDPRAEQTLVGPLIDGHAFAAMQAALAEAKGAGASITGGERYQAEKSPAAYYVRPAIAEMPRQTGLVGRETFAPILYVMRYRDFDDALMLHNGVPQGLSSSIFTTDLREAERFLSDEGSDCGIANVNIGPSGAEIGGAFGGEKETGGGRESGSDAWKIYMRRATNTINYGKDLPLAQGVTFNVGRE